MEIPTTSTTATTIIGGRRYDFSLVPPRASVPIQVMLVRVLAQPLLKAFTKSGLAKKGSSREVETLPVDSVENPVGVPQTSSAEIDMLSTALSEITAKLDSEEITKSMETVFSFASCEGRRILDMDVTFMGRPMDMWQAFAFGLRHNFQSFFQGSLFVSLQDKAAKLAQSNQQT